MSLILHIDTALDSAHLVLSKDGEKIAHSLNAQQYDHAAWIQTAIKQLFVDSNQSMDHLKSVAVVAGPGSYTGLRVGMATAKGICYAMDIPLITIDTLYLMATNAKTAITSLPAKSLLVPMIDARRMEVFTAGYDNNLNIVLPAQAMILTEASYSSLLEQGTIFFFGNGAEKWKSMCTHSNAMFIESDYQPRALVEASYSKYLRHEFTALAYAEPVYIKEFYIHPK